MKNKKETFDLRDHCPMPDGYKASRALAGKLPDCKYPSNGVPKTKVSHDTVSMDDLFAVGPKKRA